MGEPRALGRGVKFYERVIPPAMRARKRRVNRILVAMAFRGVQQNKHVSPPVIRPVTKPSVKKLPEVPVMCAVHPYKNVFPLPNVIPPLVPPLVPPSPARVASPVVGTSE